MTAFRNSTTRSLPAGTSKQRQKALAEADEILRKAGI